LDKGMELPALLALLRANGVRVYKTPELTLELAPLAPEDKPKEQTETLDPIERLEQRLGLRA
jgi:hypothetical protein